jgi:AraC family transcriptional activator of pobA
MRKKESLYDPRQGSTAITASDLTCGTEPYDPPRTNCFSIYWIEAGNGEFATDAARHSFVAGSLLFCTPYQYVRLLPKAKLRGAVIQFHANFLCVETFHAESGCAGALFNDPYAPPTIAVSKVRRDEIAQIVARLLEEQNSRRLAFAEMQLVQLKMLLILATRLKADAADHCGANGRKQRHPVLGPLKQLLEENYTTLHSPAEYAKRLHMTPKTLGRVVREQLGKSLTDLIRERILTHAKWQLLHTLKPVKQVAREVGFTDELYFSRMFKKATGYSPTFFREFETEIRGGSNLSMLSPSAPIRSAAAAADTSDS